MSEIAKIFPTSLYIENNILSDDELQTLENLILNTDCESGGFNWMSKIKNSLGTYNLNDDHNFHNLIDKVSRHVNLFNKEMGSEYNYSCQYSWFNIYEQGDYQEYHHHPNSTYSAVFFLKCDVNSSPLVFLNPIEPFDMHPIQKQTALNELNFLTCKVFPVKNSLVIFRSYIKHAVPKQTSDEKRITVAFNF